MASFVALHMPAHHALKLACCCDVVGCRACGLVSSLCKFAVITMYLYLA